MNNLTIAGYLGKEAELKYVDEKKVVCQFSVGVRHDKDATVWYTVEMWGKDRAEKISKNLPMGKKVIVQGCLKPSPRAWVDKNGRAQTRYEVYAKSVEW